MKYFLFILVVVLCVFCIPIHSQALVYYDDNKFYQEETSPEIADILQEFQQEQNVVTAEPNQEKEVDIVLFLGQSNMVGQGYSKDVTVNVKQQAGFEMRFNSSNSVAGIKYLKNSTTLNTSLIPAFANAYYNNTGVPIIAIESAVSGSSIKEWQSGKPYYETAKRKLLNTINYVQTHPENFKLRHVYMVWYQGETDSPNLAYESQLNTLFTNMKNIGVTQNFIIRIGHLYRAPDKAGEQTQKNKFNKYTEMIKLQTEIPRKSNLSVLISTRAATLSLVKGPAKDSSIEFPKISNFMHDQVHFSQLGLDLIGSEAGVNAASYVKLGKEPEIKDFEYSTKGHDFYYTGYDESTSLTEKQKDFFYHKSRTFVREGNQAGLLQYGILSKYKAYQLQLVYYGSEFYNGLKVLYMDHFRPGNYLGFDCSGFTSFLYHYVFGLSFDVNGTPWTTSNYLDSPMIEKPNSNKMINLFKYVGELKSDQKEYTLYSAREKFTLKTGDMIIGKNDNQDAHIVIYIGKVTSNNQDIVLHSTSLPSHNIAYHSTRYPIDYAYLTEKNFDGTQNFSHEYKWVTVLRLNNDILPSNFIGNKYNVDFKALSGGKTNYQFIPIFE